MSMDKEGFARDTPEIEEARVRAFGRKAATGEKQDVVESASLHATSGTKGEIEARRDALRKRLQTQAGKPE